MEKVLVTGGAGFIGSHIVDNLLENGYEVAVVDNLSSGKLSNVKDKRIQFYHCDILSGNFLENVNEYKPDYIIHQAAQVSVPNSIKDFLYDESVNIRGSLNVIDAAIKNNVKKILFASSAAVYGEPQYLPVDIEHPISPQSPYGLSKYTVEKYLQLVYQLYGLDYTILRYANVYGPNQDAQGEGGVVAIFADNLAQGKDILIYGDGTQTRDFIYVKDVANANVKALKCASNKILNVSTNSQLSIIDLLEQMKELFNSTLSPMNLEERLGDIKHSILSNKETIIELDWKPNTSIRDGLTETFMYYHGVNELLINK